MSHAWGLYKKEGDRLISVQVHNKFHKLSFKHDIEYQQEVEVRPLRQEPCACEKDSVWVEHNPKVVNGVWKYCPMCGRILEAK